MELVALGVHGSLFRLDTIPKEAPAACKKSGNLFLFLLFTIYDFFFFWVQNLVGSRS